MTLDDITIDATFEALCPPLTPDELSELAVSIAKEGFRDPLVAWGKLLIDGHNRFGIWKTHYSDDDETPQPTIVQREFKDRNAAMEWIIRNQFGRRNLTPMQRSELALKLKPLLQEKAKANQKAGGNKSGVGSLKSAEPLDTREELAKVAGVSGDTISKVEAILKSDNEELIGKVRTGEVSINAAAKTVKQKETPVETTAEKPKVKLQGVGVIRAQEAIQILRKIPKNDALRGEGFKMVRSWLAKQ